jgi:hypothetical protein
MFDAGDVVSAQRLNRLQPRPYGAVASALVPAGSTAADVPGASVTFDTEVAGAVYQAVAVFDVDPTAATTALVNGRLAVDGVAVSPLALFAAEVGTDRITVTQIYQGTLGAAGSHTLKLIATTNANQTIQTNTSLTFTITEVV